MIRKNLPTAFLSGLLTLALAPPLLAQQVKVADGASTTAGGTNR